jgi:hypothetical protein
MTKLKLTFSITAVFILLLSLNSVAQAQATRTWVSGVGDDANPCSRTAPCRTLAGTISKTAAAGQINLIDNAAVGAVTVNKAMTIEATGAFAGILATTGNGVVINAGVDDVIVLRGLTIDGANLGTNGIRFLAGGSLTVDHCTIANFLGNGILFEPSGTSHMLVKDSTIIKCINPAIVGAGGAVLVRSTTGLARATLNNVQMTRNLYGVRVESNGRASVVNSVAASNTNNGFLVVSQGGVLAELTIDNCRATNNGTNGVNAVNANAIAHISNTTVNYNVTGLKPVSGGEIISHKNNHVFGNTTADGAPTSSVDPL